MIFLRQEKDPSARKIPKQAKRQVGVTPTLHPVYSASWRHAGLPLYLDFLGKTSPVTGTVFSTVDHP